MTVNREKHFFQKKCKFLAPRSTRNHRLAGLDRTEPAGLEVKFAAALSAAARKKG